MLNLSKTPKTPIFPVPKVFKLISLVLRSAGSATDDTCSDQNSIAFSHPVSAFPLLGSLSSHLQFSTFSTSGPNQLGSPLQTVQDCHNPVIHSTRVLSNSIFHFHAVHTLTLTSVLRFVSTVPLSDVRPKNFAPFNVPQKIAIDKLDTVSCCSISQKSILQKIPCQTLSPRTIQHP